jgi:glycosyltransferase involved in cell wall biosynthesis
VRFAAETLVVDSGSQDDTVEIARACGARVIEQPWLGFGPQRRHAVAHAAHDWVLCLDADERLSPELAIAIGGALREPGHAAFEMARRNRFFGRWLRHGEGYPEHVVADGPVGRLDGDLLHASAESLDAYLAKQNRYSTLQAEAMHARGEHFSWVRLIGSPLVRFVRFYLVRAGFLDGSAGLVHIAIGCFTSFCKYAKLRALERPADLR